MKGYGLRGFGKPPLRLRSRGHNPPLVYIPPRAQDASRVVRLLYPRSPDWDAQFPVPVFTRPRKTWPYKPRPRDFEVPLTFRDTIIETVAILHLRYSISIKHTVEALHAIGLATSEEEVASLISRMIRAGETGVRVLRLEGPRDDFDAVADRLCRFYWETTDLAIPHISKLLEELGYEAGNNEVNETLWRQEINTTRQKDWDIRAKRLVIYLDNIGCKVEWQAQRLQEEGYDLSEMDIYTWNYDPVVGRESSHYSLISHEENV